MATSTFSRLAFRDRTRQEVLQRSDLIPALPDVVGKILTLLNDSGADLAECEEVLRNDTALVARMLRVVNSAFYGMPRQITSIKESVMVLGFRSLKGLILAASTSQYLEQNYSCYGFAKQGLWLHSLAVAAAGRTLAKIIGLDAATREEVFIAGLLHDIGLILLGPFMSKLDQSLIDLNSPIHELESGILGIDHQETGSLVADKWKISPLVTQVIRHHHALRVDDISDSLPDQTKKVLLLVRIANGFTHDLGTGMMADTAHPDSKYQNELDLLELDENEWEEAREEMREAVQSALVSLQSLSS